MAITKTGAMIFGQLGFYTPGAPIHVLEKTALFGSKSQSAPPPSMWQKIGGGVGRSMNTIVPGLMALGAAHDISSGKDSVGGSLGSLGGYFAGMSFGERAFDSIAKKMKPGPLKSILGVAAEMFASDIGASVGSGVGGIIAPFRRKPQKAENYWQKNDYGWNVQHN